MIKPLPGSDKTSMNSPSTAIDRDTSFNFAVAKVLAILLVVTGHYLVEYSILWVPVTVGLFIFAYSSAYFTSKKYGSNIPLFGFWWNKATRLAIPFWVSQAFLLALFIATAREGIWTWQTLAHWLGQTGWFSWLGLSNPSPFGFGLWFFTLLLLFYLAYPAIAWLQKYQPVAMTLSICVLVLMLYLQQRVEVGHMLWVTIFAFWFGVYSARHPLPGSRYMWLGMAVVFFVLLAGVSKLGAKGLNVSVLVGFAMALVTWLERTRLPQSWLAWLLTLSPCTLEIYVVHKHLFMDFGWPLAFRFLVSIIAVLTCGFLLAAIARYLERYAFHAHPARL